MSLSFSEHFSYSRLIRFTFPSIAMMIFTSLYTIVDGIFVSNVAGDKAFAALNLIWPVISIISAIGFMIGTGGSAYVAKTLGEEKHKEANEAFSQLIYASIILGAVFGLGSAFFMDEFAVLLGATPDMVADCVAYGTILVILLPAAFVQNSMLSFLVTAGKPNFGFFITLLAGISNMFLDYLFIYVFDWGISGAALATGLSWVIGAIIPLVYFICPNQSLLRLGKPSLNLKVLGKSSFNGSSEMVTNLSMSVIAILYNYELMKYLGSDGVVAYGILQYLSFIFASTFLGYNVGVSPVIAFNYGAENKKELHSLLKKSLILIGIASIAMLILSETSSRLMASIFVSYSESLMNLTVNAIRIYSINFLVCGFSIFASAFFTALNNGAISALLSFLRTFVFQAVCIIALPVFFGITGIWAAIDVAEGLSLIVSIYYLKKMQNKYGY